MRPTSRPQGFTVIELLITLVIVGILTAVALPSYRAYIQRSKVPVALDALSAVATRMEQCYQDTGTYTGCGPCNTASLPTPNNFSLGCTISTSGANAGRFFTVTATGSGPMYGYGYSIDSTGARATTAHPNGSNSTCWTTRGTTCDT